MGAIHFSADENLLKLIRDSLDLKCFVETGTFKGDTAAMAAQIFERVDSCEHSTDLYEAALKRFDASPNVCIHLGDSPEILGRLNSELEAQGVLYWLDAHWCAGGGDDEGAGQSQCPLLGELSAIGSLDSSSVVWIDDARYFLAPPPTPMDSSEWPVCTDVFEALSKLAPETHSYIVLNDTILLFPKAIEGLIHDYARKYGVDWLLYAHNTQIVIPVLHDENRDSRNQLNASRDQLNACRNQLNVLKRDLYQGDLAVIIPTKNNADIIEDHLAMVSEFLPICSEIIVVDSSSDHTLEICRSRLPSETKFIEHPPGLYQSWNSAVKTVNSDYVYVSTIGDSIDAHFLERMLRLVKKHSLDLLMTPPEFIGGNLSDFWPICKFIEKYKVDQLLLIEPEDLAALNYSSLLTFGLSSLSGSFASNIIRASILQDNPFPTKYGGFGDTMWFASIAHTLHAGILPEAGSKFLVHENSHQQFSVEHLNECLGLAVADSINGMASFGPSEFGFNRKMHQTYYNKLEALRKEQKCLWKSIRKAHFRKYESRYLAEVENEPKLLEERLNSIFGASR